MKSKDIVAAGRVQMENVP